MGQFNGGQKVVPQLLNEERESGNVCKDSNGNLGVIFNAHDITSVSSGEKEYMCEVMGFDGLSWSACNPTIISETLNEYFEDLTEQALRRFKMRILTLT